MKHTGILMVLICGLVAAGCAVVPDTREARAVLSAQVKEAIAEMKKKDPTINDFFEESYGYAVLPKVLKGGFLVSGAHGKGEVFAEGQLVGYCSMSQATLGFSFGGEFFREIVFFKRKADLAELQHGGEYTFSAQATGVVLRSGAAAKADYGHGMAVFLAAEAGLMVDVSIGGQKFKYVPTSAVE